jgi:predicted metal-dependent enzyme (double-stranded beta helix superfamily)
MTCSSATRQERRRYIEEVRVSEYPSPLRQLLTQLDELRAEDSLDMSKVGHLLVQLAADEDYLGPLVTAMPPESSGGTWLIRPERGPRLVLFHRPEGVMSYTHSHSCWLAMAPVRGVETHQQWHALCHADGSADLHLADSRAIERGEVVTLVPPGDIHSHGHAAGTGPSPYSLILLGDNQVALERKEFDLETKRWRDLQPGDPGQLDR